MTRTPSASSRRAILRRVGAAAMAAVAAAIVSAAAQTPRPVPPTFRARADLIAIDVQVVDRDGGSIGSLTADKFDVRIDGKRRHVVSADLVRLDDPVALAASAPSASGAAGDALAAPASVPHEPRLFVLTIDGFSFKADEGRAIASTARGFVSHLQADDRVAVVEFPTGPRLDPTTDRKAIDRALDLIVGAKPPASAHRFHLRPSEAVDVADQWLFCEPPPRQDIEDLMEAICGRPPSCQCQSEVASEAKSTVLENEEMAARSIAGFHTVVSALENVAGRKTVVLVSAGLPTSNRAGVYANDLSRTVGQEAARANVTVYTLFIDRGLLDTNLAETAEAPYTVTNLGRDSGMLEHWLDQFSGSAGGAFFRVAGGNPALAFQRIVKESSQYYVLGVEPDRADRDGRPHPLAVSVKQKGVTVRARTWMLVRTNTRPATAPAAPAQASDGAPQSAIDRFQPAARPIDAVSSPAVSSPAVAPPTVASSAGAPPAVSLPPPVSPAVAAVPGVPVPAARESRDAIEKAYERGDYAAVRQQLRELKDFPKWIRDLVSSPRLWAAAPHREAVFVLEVASIALNGAGDASRAEGVRLLNQYSARLARSDQSDAFECGWYWAALALFEQTEAPGAAGPLGARAVNRCATSGQVLLARALLMDWASPVVVASTPGVAPVVVAPPPSRASEVGFAYFVAMGLPGTEVEARVRLSWFLLRLRRFNDALALVADTRIPPSDRALHFVADFVRGQALRALGQAAPAEQAYRDAIADWPNAQSSSIALMTLLITQGRRQEAESLAEAIMAVPSTTDDPWKAFWHGDATLVPRLIDKLHEAIQ